MRFKTNELTGMEKRIDQLDNRVGKIEMKIEMIDK